jgi:starch synthase
VWTFPAWQRLDAWDRLFATTRSVLTIHNIGYQGVFDAGTVDDIGGDLRDWLTPEVAGRNEINWLREGIRHAHVVTTVSPTYAQEICTPLGGHGLDGVLRSRGDAPVGILNGVDYAEWDPASDRYLTHRYSLKDLSGKAATRHALLNQLNLPLQDGAPLLGIVSRLVVQKGFDLLFDTLPEIFASRDLGLVVLGSGERHYEEFFAGLQRRFPDRVAFHRGYHDELAHLIEAASDMFLMPSLYEPCGLNQLYSLKYGTVPIVRRTGGLTDTVIDATAENLQAGRATGFSFIAYTAAALLEAVDRALDLYRHHPDRWLALQLTGMRQDWSWNHSMSSAGVLIPSGTSARARA